MLTQATARMGLEDKPPGISDIGQSPKDGHCVTPPCGVPGVIELTATGRRGWHSSWGRGSECSVGTVLVLPGGKLWT